VWLTEVGVDKSTIGLFASVAIPYSLKFLWAPFMDSLNVPVLTKYLGRRSSWIVVSQLLLMLSIVLLGSADPTIDPIKTAIAALIVAFCSASQDIVVDAYRVELLPKEMQGTGAAMHVFGYRVGMLLSSAGALYLAEYYSWFTVYTIIAIFVVAGLVAVLITGEPDINKSTLSLYEKAQKTREQREMRHYWLKHTLIDPFTDFMKRNHWLAILIFIILYKLGDALAGVMTNTFLVEIGFSKTEIATIVKTYGFVATILGSFIGGALVYKYGVLNILWIGGILQMLSNLMFAVQSYIGYDTDILAITIAVENLTGGIGSAAFVAYISGLCSVSFTASQYALLSSLAAVGRTVFASFSGYMAEHWGWVEFFVLTTGAAIPGLLVLWYLTWRSAPWERQAQ
ncbi:MAG: AmpG family muropeptide MFS transporter, partial [Burkholderiales bacterium]